MPETPPPVRSAGRALIVEAGRVLAIRYRDDVGDWHNLPGGGQRNGELLRETVARECREELGVCVRVGDLKYVREYIAADRPGSVVPPGFHQVEHVFACEIIDRRGLGNGGRPDDAQLGWDWLPVADLAERRFYPATLGRLIAEGLPASAPVYIGDAR